LVKTSNLGVVSYVSADLEITLGAIKNAIKLLATIQHILRKENI